MIEISKRGMCPRKLPDSMVIYPAHDYWHSCLARDPDVGASGVAMSEYHGAFKLTDDVEVMVKEVILL